MGTSRNASGAATHQQSKKDHHANGDSDLDSKSGTDEDQKKSRRIDYKVEDSTFATARFIFECGYKLKAAPIAIASAATLFHRFYVQFNGLYDKYLMATTALYISGKLNDEKYKLRDVINVAHHTLHRGTSPLDLKDEYWARRDSVIQAELLMMRVLKFEAKVTTPHKYLLHYLITLKTWIPKQTWDAVPICQASLAFLQDLHHDPAVLDYPVQNIALACIHLALQSYGVSIPGTKEAEEKGWFSVFVKDVTIEAIWEIIDVIIDVYNVKLPSSTD